MPILVYVKRFDSFIFVSIVCVKRSDSFISIFFTQHKKAIWWTNFEQVKFWTLIKLMNNFVIALVCTKCFKLITSEENIMSVQQLPLCYISVLCFCFTGNFSKLYCCKDCKNVITDKKFSSEQSLFVFQALEVPPEI